MRLESAHTVFCCPKYYSENESVSAKRNSIGTVPEMSSMFHLREKRTLQGSTGWQLKDLNSLQGNIAPLCCASTILLRVDDSESVRLPITHHRGTRLVKPLNL
jgi:hypothetical protein